MDESPVSVDPEQHAEMRSLKPAVAGCLAFFAIGVGQFYTGRLRLGLWLAGLQLALWVLMLLFVVRVSLIGLAVTFVLLWGVWLVALIEAVRYAWKHPVVEPQRHATAGYFLGYVVVFVVAVSLIVTVIHPFRFEAFRCPTGAMENTLLVNDYFVETGYQGAAPAPGDVVVFRYPADESLTYVKRIAAGPRQTLEIRDRAVYVDGVQAIESPGVKFTSPEMLPADAPERGIFAPEEGGNWNRDHYGPVTVPEDCYFILGDNRDNSADSRYWGFLPKPLVIGKAKYIYWSWDKQTSRPRWSRIGQSVQ